MKTNDCLMAIRVAYENAITVLKSDIKDAHEGLKDYETPPFESSQDAEERYNMECYCEGLCLSLLQTENSYNNFMKLNLALTDDELKKLPQLAF